jgi:predicted membrane protein
MQETPIETGTPPPAVRVTSHVIFGLVLVLVGVAFTLDKLDIVEARRILAYWPVGLIAIGLAKLSQAGRAHGGAFGGVLFVVAGSWLLLDNLHLIDVNLLGFWPILLVIGGAVLLWQGLHPPRERSGRADASVNAVAVLSGVSRGSNSQTFRGGELTAFMGGCEIDLRQAAIHGEAVIEVFAVWGGIQIRVPENWTVVGRVTPLMGGFDDTTRAPRDATAHTLVIRGLVLMGGIEVKN